MAREEKTIYVYDAFSGDTPILLQAYAFPTQQEGTNQ